MVAFIVQAVIIVLSPLLVFMPNLINLRRTGMVGYSRLANQHMELFEEKWVHGKNPDHEPLLGHPDLSSQRDLGTDFSVVRELNIAPFGKRHAVWVAVQAALPLLVLLIAATPATTVVHTNFKMVM